MRGRAWLPFGREMARCVGLVAGFVLLALLVAGCGGTGGSGLAPVVTGGGGGAAAALTAANSLYAIQPGDAIFLPATPAYLLQYAKGTTGAPGPVTEITSQSQVLFDGVAMDGTGKLYVSAVTAGKANETEILVYQVGSSGKVTPVATYPTPEPGLDAFNVGEDGKVYLVAGGTIWVTVEGAVTRSIVSPVQTVTDADALSGAKGIAADAGGTVYVLNGAAAGSAAGPGPTPVLVYGAGVTGKAAPSGTIEGDKTGFTTASALAVDRAGNVYVGTSTAVLVFAAGAMGNVAPVRVIAGAATSLDGVVDMKVDANGALFVLTGNAVTGAAVLQFAAGATGNAAPITTLAPEVVAGHVTQGFGGIAVM